jgi:L-ascorbate metabolism protein UlaG (beta-lactamase superfamily)
VVRAKLTIPQHFGTFAGIVQNADGFAAELKKLRIGFYEMKPGETITFRGKQFVRTR